MSLRSASEAEQAADRLRGELAATLDNLVGNLMPDKLVAEAGRAVASRTPPWLEDYWRLARGPVGLGIVGAAAASLAVGAAGMVVRRRRRPLGR